MDQKLLDALNNLSEALEQIAGSLKDKKGDKSATTQALQGGNFISEIKEINVGVKQLQKDSKKILKNQETLLQLSKKKDKKSDFEKAGGDKKQESNIKKGVGTILLIAVAVLAIGVAFKLVGGINFLAVIGLSIGILIVAKAFEKVAALNLSLKQAAVVSASMVLMAFGITMSSWIMKRITPISLSQSLTAILIGVGFSAMAPAISKLIKAFGGMGLFGAIKSIIFLPLVLPAIAVGITLSSWVLRMITPISLSQAITAILIAGMFTVVSFGIKKLLGAFGNSFFALTKAVIFLPLVLPAIALGIAMSSWALRKVTPISFGQAITSILIGVVFAVIGFGLKKLLGAFGGNSILGLAAAILFLPSVMEAVAEGIVRASFYLKKTEKIGWTQAWSAILIAAIFTVIGFGLKQLVNAMDAIDNPLGILLVPLLLPAMAYAIQLSSDFLSKVTLITMDQFWTSLGVAAVFVVFAFALKLMGPSIDKIGLGAVVKIPLLFTALSAAIWASSKILSKATVMDNEFLKKLLKFAIVSALAIAVMAGVSFLMSKIGFMNILKGVLAIPVLAGVIFLSSKILSLGTYNKGAYPSVGWSLGVGLSIAAFAAGAAILGPMVFGPQALLFAAGLGAVLAVAGTVVAASHILAGGNYKKGPNLLWAISTSMIMQTFGTLVAILGIMPKSWVKDGTNAVKAVVQSIVDAAWIFHNAKGAFVGGPTKEWAEGVGIAIGAFSPVYSMMMMNGVAKLFGGSGLGPDEFAVAIVTVSKGIIDAAAVFADPKNTAVWKGGPTKEWAEGVGTAIGAFSPVYGMMMDGGITKALGIGGVGPEEFATAVVTVSKGIIAAAGVFAENVATFDEGKYPSAKWGQGVGAALNAFAPVFKSLSEDSGWFTSKDEVIDGMVNGVLRMAGAIVGVAYKFSAPGINWESYPNSLWSWKVRNGVLAYANLAKLLSTMEVDWMMQSDLNRIVDGVVHTARLFGMNEKHFNSKINPDFMKSVSSNLYYYMEIAKELRSRQGTFDFLDNAVMGDPIVNMAKGMVFLAHAYDKLAASITRMGQAMENLNEKKISQLERISRIALHKRGDGDRVESKRESSRSIQAPVRSEGVAVNPAPSGASAKRIGSDRVGGPRGKYGDLAKQNDMVIDLLQQLNANIGANSLLSMYLMKHMDKKDSSMY